MKLLKTVCLLGGWAFFLVSGMIVFALWITSDTALSIYKVWKR